MDSLRDERRGWRQTPGGQLFLPAPDSLWRDAPAPLCSRFSVLGVPLEVSTNAPVLDAMARETFGDWGSPAPDQAGDPRKLRVYLHDPDEVLSGEPFPLLTRVQKRYLLLNCGGSFGFGDRAAGFAAAFVTPQMAADAQRTQVYFLECPGMYLVCGERPVVLHAAAVVHNGRCALLTGADGAGKSTLAYACVRAGFQLLAEDIVFGAAPGTPFQAWGNPWYLHLLPDAPRHFPELAGHPLTTMVNGESKLRLKVNALHPGAALPNCAVWGVVSLGRGSGSGSRICAADSANVRRLLTTLKGSPPLDPGLRDAAVDGLLAGPMAHLEAGADLDGAVAALRHLLDAG